MYTTGSDVQHSTKSFEAAWPPGRNPELRPVGKWLSLAQALSTLEASLAAAH